MEKASTREIAVPPTLVTATIPAGESLSNSFDCSTQKPLRCATPEGWNGSMAGMPIITFQCSHDGVAFKDLFNLDGTEMAMIVIPNTVVLITADFGAKTIDTHLRVRAGRRDTPVVQTADRIFTFVLG